MYVYIYVCMFIYMYVCMYVRKNILKKLQPAGKAHIIKLYAFHIMLCLYLSPDCFIFLFRF